MMEVLFVRAGAAALILVSMVAAASGEPYHIMTNSPVHITGTGNESIRVYGEAPGALTVIITIANQTYEGMVRDDTYHVVIPAPDPGVYSVSGTWHANTLHANTAGHLAGTTLTVFGMEYGAEPDTIVTVHPGAHLPECSNCMDHTDGIVEAGGHVLVSNADTEGHQFATDYGGAAPTTGHIDPGESVRLSFTHEGEASYRCMYHPWLVFAVNTAGTHRAPNTDGVIVLDAPDFAADSVRLAISHTGGAEAAHIIFIQYGEVLEAGVIRMTDGYGTYVADAREWSIGEVIVSVSAGMDHTSDTISVRPPPGAAERTGRVTGYDGPDGILVDNILARPAGITSLDAAGTATRQICMEGREALFRGDAGLAPLHYIEGTIWCGGVNLGVYLLESGLAMADPAVCHMVEAPWLAPYCGITPVYVDEPVQEVEPDIPEDIIPDIPEDIIPEITIPEIVVPEIIIPADDPPAIPHTGCDHYTDPTCPCPEGWVRNGEWCDPEGTIMDATAQDVGIAVDDTREEAVDALAAAFEWLFGVFGDMGDFIMDASRMAVG